MGPHSAAGTMPAVCGPTRRLALPFDGLLICSGNPGGEGQILENCGWSGAVWRGFCRVREASSWTPGPDHGPEYRQAQQADRGLLSPEGYPVHRCIRSDRGGGCKGAAIARRDTWETGQRGGELGFPPIYEMEGLRCCFSRGCVIGPTEHKKQYLTCLCTSAAIAGLGSGKLRCDSITCSSVVGKRCLGNGRALWLGLRAVGQGVETVAVPV